MSFLAQSIVVTIIICRSYHTIGQHVHWLGSVLECSPCRSGREAGSQYRCGGRTCGWAPFVSGSATTGAACSLPPRQTSHLQGEPSDLGGQQWRPTSAKIQHLHRGRVVKDNEDTQSSTPLETGDVPSCLFVADDGSGTCYVIGSTLVLI